MSAPTFIFVDGSYYCFHRYFALHQWWKNAYPDEPLEDPLQNEKFVEKFRKTFIEHLEQIPKKLKIHKDPVKPIMIIGRDCKRDHIWRNDLYKDYKANRANGVEDGFMGGPFFKMAYDDDLFIKAGAKAILSHARLEADDCIAITVRHYLALYPACKIYIITSDHDYLQLAADNVQLFTLSFKPVVSSMGDSKLDLRLKIIMGDTSDNIPPIFPKCGPKTAKKCIEDDTFFQKKMENENYKDQYSLNEHLVSFDKIPVNYIEEFMATNSLALL